MSTYRLGKRIEFFGTGNSSILAQDAQHKFFSLGITSIAYSDGHMHVISASLLGLGDCVMATFTLQPTIEDGYERYSPMMSRLLHLIIMEMMATCVALRIGTKLQPLLNEMKSNQTSRRYA